MARPGPEERWCGYGESPVGQRSRFRQCHDRKAVGLPQGGEGFACYSKRSTRRLMLATRRKRVKSKVLDSGRVTIPRAPSFVAQKACSGPGQPEDPLTLVLTLTRGNDAKRRATPRAKNPLIYADTATVGNGQKRSA